MKRASILILSSLFTIITILPSMVYGQTVSSQKLPDYTAWEKVDSGTISVALNGRDTKLLAEVYSKTDPVNLKRGTIELIYNETGDPWIAMYTEEIGERHSDGSITTKEAHLYMFEKIRDKWVLVRDSLGGDIRGFIDFLKTRYGLEFK